MSIVDSDLDYRKAGLDLIHINDLRARGRHGVSEAERSSPQELRVDLTLWMDLASAGNSDDLEATLDYRVVKKTVVGIIENESCLLIETIADKIINALPEDKRVHFIEVKIQKLHIWADGVPGVTIFRPTRATLASGIAP